MDTNELIKKINYLARKERYEGLTGEEKEEQKQLREEYLQFIRKQITDTLEGAGFEKKNNDDNNIQ